MGHGADAGPDHSDTSVVRRAAFDIGSGSMKLQVADVRVSQTRDESASIVRIIHGEEVPVKFGIDLSLQPNRSLSSTVREKGIVTLRRLIKTAIQLGASAPFVGVATAVFRKATNGPAYLQELCELGIQAEVATQELEARLGYQTCVAVDNSIADNHQDNLVVWDSGSGSFQISMRDNTGSMQAFMGGFGAATALRMCIADVQGREYHGSGSSPNPVSKRQANDLIERIRNIVPMPRPEWVRTAPIVHTLGGPNSIFRVAADCIGNTIFTGHMVRDAIAHVEGRSDIDLAAELCTRNRSDGPNQLLPKLCLLYAVMTALGIGKVKVVPVIGCCGGILLDDSLFL